MPSCFPPQFCSTVTLNVFLRAYLGAHGNLGDVVCAAPHGLPRRLQTSRPVWSPPWASRSRRISSRRRAEASRAAETALSKRRRTATGRSRAVLGSCLRSSSFVAYRAPAAPMTRPRRASPAWHPTHLFAIGGSSAAIVRSSTARSAVSRRSPPSEEGADALRETRAWRRRP